MRSIDDATVSTTDRKGFRKQDRVDEIKDVKGAVEGDGAVHVPEERGRVDRESRGAENVHAVVVEVLGVVGRRADCSTVGSLAWAARRTAWASWICFCVGGRAAGGIVGGRAGGLEDVTAVVPSGVSRRFLLHV